MNELNALDESGVYDVAPAQKPRRSYAQFAAKVNDKLAANKAAKAPAVAGRPDAPAMTPEMAANQFGLGGAQQNAQGMQGFGDIMQTPEAWLAGQKLAELHGDQSSLAMMNSGKPNAVPYGGLKHWSEAAAEGLKTGIGMYNFMKRGDAVAEALREYKGLFDKRAAQQTDKRLAGAFAQGRGSGQHSVQGNPDYEFDL